MPDVTRRHSNTECVWWGEGIQTTESKGQISKSFGTNRKLQWTERLLKVSGLCRYKDGDAINFAFLPHRLGEVISWEVAGALLLLFVDASGKVNEEEDSLFSE